MRYIAILRGINVGGKRVIKMDDLKAKFRKMGFTNLKTYIQSGNIHFEDKNNSATDTLALKIEKMIENEYKFKVPVIIRTQKEIEIAISNNPFYHQENIDIKNLHLTFLKKTPAKDDCNQIKNIDFSPDKFEMIDNNVFIFCADKYSKSKLSNSFFEKKLKVSATTRNWKTCLKLLELIDSE